MTPGRRSLRFNSTDEIIADVERLRRGCKTVGEWSPAHIYGHLASVIEMILKAPAPAPGSPPPATRMSPEQRDEVFASGLIPEGLPQPESLAAYQPGTEAEEADRLRAALVAFEASPGPVAHHRYFGPLSPEQWKRLNCIHCAHHLSFAVPNES